MLFVSGHRMRDHRFPSLRKLGDGQPERFPDGSRVQHGVARVDEGRFGRRVGGGLQVRDVGPCVKRRGVHEHKVDVRGVRGATGDPSDDAEDPLDVKGVVPSVPPEHDGIPRNAQRLPHVPRRIGQRLDDVGKECDSGPRDACRHCRMHGALQRKGRRKDTMRNGRHRARHPRFSWVAGHLDDRDVHASGLTPPLDRRIRPRVHDVKLVFIERVRRIGAIWGIGSFGRLVTHDEHDVPPPQPPCVPCVGPKYDFGAAQTQLVGHEGHAHALASFEI